VRASFMRRANGAAIEARHARCLVRMALGSDTMKSRTRTRETRAANAAAAQSVAGEEDPGASLDTTGAADAPAPRSPGDEASPGTPGTGATVCGRCGGSGRFGDAPCPTCGGTGTVVRGISG